eukprot:scaffold133115_cov36-Tisochrysis_lutea.AAC.2
MTQAAEPCHLRRSVGNGVDYAPHAHGNHEEGKHPGGIAGITWRVVSAVGNGECRDREGDGDDQASVARDPSLAQLVCAPADRECDEEVGGTARGLNVSDVGIVAKERVEELDEHSVRPDRVCQPHREREAPHPRDVPVDGATTQDHTARIAALAGWRRALRPQERSDALAHASQPAPRHPAAGPERQRRERAREGLFLSRHEERRERTETRSRRENGTMEREDERRSRRRGENPREYEIGVCSSTLEEIRLKGVEH